MTTSMLGHQAVKSSERCRHRHVAIANYSYSMFPQDRNQSPEPQLSYCNITVGLANI